MGWKMNDLRSTYVYLNMGKIQVRRIFGNADESRFGRCEAVFAATGFKNVLIILRVLID